MTTPTQQALTEAIVRATVLTREAIELAKANDLPSVALSWRAGWLKDLAVELAKILEDGAPGLGDPDPGR